MSLPWEEWKAAELAAAIDRDDPDELSSLVVWVALALPGRIQAEQFCIRLSRHWHPQVRGNAVLGFGHLARIYRYLNRDLVKPIVEAALSDHEFIVRHQADAAAGDIEWFLGWVLRGREHRRFVETCPR